MTFLVDPRKVARDVVAQVMQPPPPADLNLWAERNIMFGNESPIPGPYRRETIPAAERILECLGPEHPSRVVAVKSSAQFFKTTLGQIFIGASMDIDPCDIGYTLPTHSVAMSWARSKWKVMRRQSKALTRIFGEVNVRSRDVSDTTLYQETRDGRGRLTISGANSANELSMKSWPKQVQDEISKWEANEAGDPEGQADDRSSAFDWAKVLKISTPLDAKTCRIAAAYKRGTQEKFHVPCPHPECGHYQPLEWSNFQANLDRDNPAKSCFSCTSCGGLIEHRHKQEIIAKGRWVADNPQAKEPSFYIWRAYTPFRDWESIAREWFDCEGIPSKEQRFFNSVLGLEFERASDAPSWEGIRNRANGIDEHGNDVPDVSTYERGRIPPGGLLINVGVDVQGDRVEVHFKAFGEQLRRYTIDYEIIPHFIGTDEAVLALDKLLTKKFPDAFGNFRGVDMLAIDGNTYTKDVFAWAKRHPWTKVIVVRGANSDLAPPLALTKTERKPDGSVRKTQKRFYNVGVSGLKSSLYEVLRRPDPLARGFCGYPKGLDDEFYRQLTAEKRVVSVNKRTGFPKAEWQKDGRNEVLDTENYAEAAAIRCGWYTRTAESWAQLRAEREKVNESGTVDLFDPARDAATTSAHATKPTVRNIADIGRLLNG